MNLIPFEYNGNTFEVDADMAKDYEVLRGLALVRQDLPGFFNSMNLLFNGKDAEYCKLVGGFDEMADLVAKAMEVADAKN